MKASQSILNLALRLLSVGARFLLVLYLGKFFSLDDLGFYGIFYATITLSLYLLGLDFYSYSNREIVLVEDSKKLTVLRNQLVFYGATYCIFFLPLLLLFYYQILSIEFLFYFYIILILEHLSQEIFRIFIVLGYPVLANWIFFLRMGSWIYVLILIWIINPHIPSSLAQIWWGWIAGSAISIIIGFTKIYYLYRGQQLEKLSWKWFKKGMKVSVYFFGSTVALRIIELSNRYLIEHWYGIKSVGLFTFYSQFANVTNIIIFTLFVMVIYPKLIIAANENNFDEFKRLKIFMMKKILVYSLLLAIMLVISIKPILYFIQKEEFLSEISCFYILIFSNIFFNISLVYHYVLYAMNKDLSLFISTGLSAVINIILNILLIRFYGIKGAAIAMLVSYVILTIIKAAYSKKTVLK